GTTNVNIPNSGYSGRPFVLLTVWDNSILQQANFIGLGGINAGSFTVVSHDTSGAPSSTSFFWRSIGTRVL
ncbi:MAG TPA: hypothetical protein VJS20_00920, partial [Gemmatimonadales bacterium]|nr:hypothetical protein [Gemmatimonadales bacterium]